MSSELKIKKKIMKLNFINRKTIFYEKRRCRDGLMLL